MLRATLMRSTTTNSRCDRLQLCLVLYSYSTWKYERCGWYPELFSGDRGGCALPGDRQAELDYSLADKEDGFLNP